MVTENIQLEAVGERLSHRLIQRVTIDYDDIFNLWYVNVKCSIPKTVSEQEKVDLKEALKRKLCHGKCHFMIDREGMDKVIALLQSNSIMKYEIIEAKVRGKIYV